MKTLILTTAAALTLSTAAYADTAADFARQHFAADKHGIEALIVEGTDRHSPRAIAIFEQLAAEDTGAGRELMLSSDGMSVSTKGAVNNRAAAIFAEIRASEEHADK